LLIGGLYVLIVGLKLSRPTSRRIIMLSDLFIYYWLEALRRIIMLSDLLVRGRRSWM